MRKRKNDNGLSKLFGVDTSVFIHDPKVLNALIIGNNAVVVGLTVIKELDNLKNKERIGWAAREAIRQIKARVLKKDPKLFIEKNMNFDDLSLEKDKHDFEIIAMMNYVIGSDKYAGYDHYELITKDSGLELIALSVLKSNNVSVGVSDYKKDKVKLKNSHEVLRVINLLEEGKKLPYTNKQFGEINENSGILIRFDETKSKNTDGAKLFIRKGGELQVISDETILFGLKALSRTEGKINFGQLLAFRQLTDDGIKMVCMKGRTGSGKTLLAIAAALQQTDKFRQIIIGNPMVPLGNKDKLGFAPGTITEKISRWLIPYEDNLRFLESEFPRAMEKLAIPEAVSKKPQSSNMPQREQRVWEKYGFVFMDMETIKGSTYVDTWIIVDEAENLTPSELKTIVTRLGKGSKLILCGDLGQTDIYLDEESSGFAYVMEKMVGTAYDNKMVGMVYLAETLRSPLADFADRVL
jgi:PhoH-like ATPase